MTQEDRLLLRVRGFKVGAAGAAPPPTISNNEDFLLGHQAGRDASKEHYAIASKELGVELSPLREEEE